MAKNMDALAKKLGASVVGAAPDYSPGAFGMAALANTLRRRPEPSVVPGVKDPAVTSRR